ncbi:MAG TPA: hypothetical protein VJU87_11015 [Gemmatimonadaceae bacterium]|nr:hypothetical protein [Gemmatimonadaceae bacterium]
MKRLSLIAAALLFVAAPHVHAQAAQQQGAKKADGAVAVNKTAHAARSAPKAAVQTAMAPVDTAKKARTHKSAKAAKSAKMASAPKAAKDSTAKPKTTAHARRHRKAKADTAKKGS